MLTWLMAICLVCSAAARIWIFGMKGTEGSMSVWSQVVLPVAATLLYVAIALLNGNEFFYKTAIPVWMMTAYCAIWVANNIPSKLMVWLFWIAVVFLAYLYTDITSGRRPKFVWLLLPIMLATLATILYVNQDSSMHWDAATVIKILPEMLMLIGCSVLVFGIKVHPADEYHPTWGDRSDGRRIRTLPPMAQVSPYIMVQRNESSNLFEDAFEVTAIDRYIRQKRKEGLAGIGIMHVLLATYCRGVARYPALNRFLAGQKVYSRGDDIQFCLTVKKEMSVSSPDTVIKVHLSPKDTIYDVYNKVNAEIDKVKNSPLDSSFDNTAHLFMLVPGVCLKFLVWVLKVLDYFGLLPAFLLEVSPFHGSLFLTSMGSLGIPAIYHHLYDFGNLPVFGAFGCKRRATEITEDGTIVQRKYVDFKFALDERICDGYYYAAFFKHFKRIIAHPELLDQPPEEVAKDID